MLNKEIDHVIIGSSYLSYFLGIKSLNSKHSTLILDDHRFKFGGLFQSKFTELDRAFMKQLGETHNIESFKNIDEFLKPCPYYIHVNGSILRLGDSPLRNFKEVGRKLHVGLKKESKTIEHDVYYKVLEEVDEDQFNFLFSNFCHELAEAVQSLPSIKHFDLSTFFKCAPQFLVDFFDTIASRYSDQESTIRDAWSLQCLLYSLRGIFQDNFSFSISKFELFHLLVSLLSKSYHLDYSAFNKSLHNEFNQLGGNLREVELEQWLFDKNRPWALMLSSFEGVVKPGEVSFVGPRPQAMPIDITPLGEYYASVEFSWQIDSKNSILPPEGITFFCCSDAIGTEMPFFWTSVEGNKVTVCAYLLWCEGRKFEFYIDRLKEYLLKEINQFYMIDRNSIISESVRELRDIALSGVAAGGTFEQVSSNKIHVLDNTDISNKTLVGGVNYWGQFRKFPLGKYSMLLDLCLS